MSVNSRFFKRVLCFTEGKFQVVCKFIVCDIDIPVVYKVKQQVV